MPASSPTISSNFEKLSKYVGEYKGYQNSEFRKISDKAVRVVLIKNIEKLIKQLEVDYRATEDKDQERLNSLVTSAKRKLRTLCQSLNTPTYQHAKFFTLINISNQALERIYDLEENMIEETINIENELKTLTQDGIEKEIFEDHFLRIQNFIDNMNQALFEREALIIGDE